MSGCASDSAALAAGEQAKAAEAAAIEAARIAGERPLVASQPAECAGPVRAGVKLDEAGDVALLRYDRALGQANALLKRCHEFHADAAARANAGHALAGAK